MKKKYIVKENSDFDSIIKNAMYKKDNNVVIYYRNNSLDYNRFGISVGTKIGHAVVRNTLKRKMRSIIDNNKFCYEKSKDYIIIVRKNCLNVQYSDICNSYRTLINYINNRGVNNEKK